MLPIALAAEEKLGASALSVESAPVVSGVRVVVMRRIAAVVSGKVPGRKARRCHYKSCPWEKEACIVNLAMSIGKSVNTKVALQDSSMPKLESYRFMVTSAASVVRSPSPSA